MIDYWEIMVSNVFDESYQLDFDKAIEQSRWNVIDLKGKKSKLIYSFIAISILKCTW
jgi:hypothetical protein